MMIGTMIRWGAIFGWQSRRRRHGIAGLLIAGILAPIAATLDPARDFAHARVPGRCERRQADAQSAVSRQRAAQARGRQRADAAGCEPGDGAHVHRESAERSGNIAPVLDPSADRGANPSARADGVVGTGSRLKWGIRWKKTKISAASRFRTGDVSRRKAKRRKAATRRPPRKRRAAGDKIQAASSQPQARMRSLRPALDLSLNLNLNRAGRRPSSPLRRFCSACRSRRWPRWARCRTRPAAASRAT